MNATTRKEAGAYYTPDDTVASLVRWAVQSHADRLLDPSCGDGRFLARHRRSAGVEQDSNALAVAIERAPWAMIHEGNFFTWASETTERFECAAGNPPFIRYQRFTGDVRANALRLCQRLGASFSALTTSWAPFLVATASLLKPGGRMAFVVPAEIGHAPYAIPLLEYLADNFEVVQLLAVHRKLFPDLSEDCWLLYTAGFGGATDHFGLTAHEAFQAAPHPPEASQHIGLREWRRWNCRLRPFLLPGHVRAVYEEVVEDASSVRLGEVAKVGVGYVTGDNSFFHLRPSEAAQAKIPQAFLHPTVRNGRALTTKAVTHATVKAWLTRDEPVQLLRIQKGQQLPASIQRYLDTDAGRQARLSYKCRNRQPWYVVPDVYEPDAFLSYMSGQGPVLVANHARCVCTNSVHAVTLKGGMTVRALQQQWADPFTSLSCEIEGHPLGGGMLKVEPREAASVVLPPVQRRTKRQQDAIQEGITIMRRWRHCG